MSEPVPEGSAGERAPEREFMCGAAMVAGLFFLGSSYVYKLVFAVWLLPWLWRQRGAGGPGKRRAGLVMALLLAVVWLEGAMAVVLNLAVSPAWPAAAEAVLKVTLAVAQLCTWALVACLLRLLLAYVARRAWALWRAA